MGSNLSRRRILSSGGSAVLLSLIHPGVGGLLRFAHGQTTPTAPGAIRLTDRLTLITGAGGNVVLAADGDSVAAVDSGAAEHTPALLELLAERAGGRPVQTLFNTHWHLSHTGGNAALSGAGAEIVAHENTRLWMTTQFYVRWEDRTYAVRETAAHPTRTFFSHERQPLTLNVGTQMVEYGQLENAHTDGDIYVFFPNDNVLVAGGAASVGRYPIPDYSTGGWIDGLIESTQKLMQLADNDTVVVAGNGLPQRRGHLQTQYDMVATLRERIAERMRLGKSAEEMMADGITDDFDADWGGRELGRLFVSNSYEDLAWRGPGGSL